VAPILKNSGRGHNILSSGDTATQIMTRNHQSPSGSLTELSLELGQEYEWLGHCTILS